jgi:hypothetical protein
MYIYIIYVEYVHIIVYGTNGKSVPQNGGYPPKAPFVHGIWGE